MKKVVAVLCALGALSGWVVWRYRSTTEVSPYDLAVRSVAENAADGARIGAKPVQIGELRALIRHPTSGSAWVIYWGGNTSAYFKECVETVRLLGLPDDVGVLIVAPPGYDGSAGYPTPENVPVAAVAAREWLIREHQASIVITGGFSMGALSAIAAAQHSVFLLSAPTLFETGDPSPFIRLKTPVRYRPPVEAPKVRALVIHGENDDGFPIQMGRDVAHWLGGRFIGLPNVGHADLQTSAQALSEVRAFVIAEVNPERR